MKNGDNMKSEHNDAMKAEIAKKMLEKLGGIDTANLHSITIEMVMNGGDLDPGEMKGMKGMSDTKKGQYCPDCGQKEENCQCDTEEETDEED